MDHLNIFYPYDNKPLNHEDQLTRALLILARNIKPVEMTLVDLIIDQMERNRCELIPPRLTKSKTGIDIIKTQIWSSTANELMNQIGSLVSVLITDEKLKPEHKVSRTERTAVYDAVIRYKPDWVFVLENKPDHRNVWPDQLSSAFSETFTIEQKPVVLRWQEIISRMSLLQENKLVQSSEASLIGDFLDFVSDQFPELNPYDRFGLCKDDPYLLTRRCISIMEESNLGAVDYHRGWKHSIESTNTPGIKEIAISPNKLSNEEWDIQLEMYPGDTINQARHFYSSLDIEKFLQLSNANWETRTNLHFSFQSSGLVWTTASCTLRDYLLYWKGQATNGFLRQITRDEWSTNFQTFRDLGMLSPQDEPDLTKKIINTAMQKLNVCPGVACRFRWSKSEAIDLDEKGAFVLAFVQKVNECLSTWIN